MLSYRKTRIQLQTSCFIRALIRPYDHQQLHGLQVQFDPHLHACPPSAPKLISEPSTYLLPHNIQSSKQQILCFCLFKLKLLRINQYRSNHIFYTYIFVGATPSMMVVAAEVFSTSGYIPHLQLKYFRTNSYHLTLIYLRWDSNPKLNNLKLLKSYQNIFKRKNYPLQPLPHLQSEPQPHFPPQQDIFVG